MESDERNQSESWLLEKESEREVGGRWAAAQGSFPDATPSGKRRRAKTRSKREGALAPTRGEFEA